MGIRELNQNSGRIIHSLAETGPVIVTDHGRPVAVISPYQEPERSSWERLVRDGLVRPATADDILSLPKINNRTGLTSDELIAETRGDH